MPGPDLQALVADAAAADPVARDRAFTEFLRLISIFVRVRMGNRLRDHRESADVCQSIAKSFVDDASRGLLKFDSPAALNAYLQQVVRSKLAELHRHDTADKRGGPDAGPEQSPDFAEAGDPTASVDALSEEAFERVRAGLTPDEMELVLLRRRGVAWSTISDTLRTPEALLRQRWSRLQRRLIELLSESR